MFLFRKKQSKLSADQEPLSKINEHKSAVREAGRKNKRADIKLKRIYGNNHFTVNIALAMGAKEHVRGANHHGH